MARSNKYICITRPRRFGKTVMACMIASYFGRGQDSRGVFGSLQISACEGFENHLNRHNVIYISLNEMPWNCTSYRQYIERIQGRILAVGIAYHKETKKHSCKIEVLRDALQ